MAKPQIFRDGAEYDNQSFGRDSAVPAQLERADFTDCTFSGCSLGSVRLLGCRFFDCRFERVDASAANLNDCTFRGTTFVDCKLLGINWTILRSLQACNWERCLLDDSSFGALELEAVEWIECRLRQVDFSDCNLRRAKFHGSLLVGANFNGAQLAQADFAGVSDLALDPHYVRLGETSVEMVVVLRMAELLGLKIVGS